MALKGKDKPVEIATLTDVIIEETLRDKKGAPLILSDVLSLETGLLSKQLLEKARGASEIKLAYDKVSVKRYATVEELATLAERAKGGGK